MDFDEMRLEPRDAFSLISRPQGWPSYSSIPWLWLQVDVGENMGVRNYAGSLDTIA
jgi:hypothetical protein